MKPAAHCGSRVLSSQLKTFPCLAYTLEREENKVTGTAKSRRVPQRYSFLLTADWKPAPERKIEEKHNRGLTRRNNRTGTSYINLILSLVPPLSSPKKNGGGRGRDGEEQPYWNLLYKPHPLSFIPKKNEEVEDEEQAVRRRASEGQGEALQVSRARWMSLKPPIVPRHRG